MPLIKNNYCSITFVDVPTKEFIKVVDTELMALHEGNIAKFKIKPHEFHAWQDVWIERKDE